MQLLRTILIIIIIFYLIRIIARYVLPFLARYFIKKSMKNYRDQYQAKEKKEGEININYAPEKKKNLDNIGEYIDYEEIKDDKNK